MMGQNRTPSGQNRNDAPSISSILTCDLAL